MWEHVIITRKAMDVLNRQTCEQLYSFLLICPLISEPAGLFTTCRLLVFPCPVVQDQGRSNLEWSLFKETLKSTKEVERLNRSLCSKNLLCDWNIIVHHGNNITDLVEIFSMLFSTALLWRTPPWTFVSHTRSPTNTFSLQHKRPFSRPFDHQGKEEMLTTSLHVWPPLFELFLNKSFDSLFFLIHTMLVQLVILSWFRRADNYNNNSVFRTL